ncbi:MAG: hypothetical protein J6D08_04820 [Lachnospiraceae bacterium]|nr:hypothetical protein [Lachnospiraceae bacterium]
MGRKQERIRRNLEKNPVVECNQIIKKYCPELFWDFANTKDPTVLSEGKRDKKEAKKYIF